MIGDKKQATEVTEIDVLTHPFWNVDVYGKQWEREGYVPLALMKKQAQAWGQRIKELAGRESSVLIIQLHKSVHHDVAKKFSPEHKKAIDAVSKQLDSLIKFAERMLGSSRVVVLPRDELLELKKQAVVASLRQIFKERGWVFQKSITLNPYGELEGVCARAAGEGLTNFLKKSNPEIKIMSRNIPELLFPAYEHEERTRYLFGRERRIVQRRSKKQKLMRARKPI